MKKKLLSSSVVTKQICPKNKALNRTFDQASFEDI
jgi:hypothetical protein